MRVVAWGVVVDAMDVPESGADLSSWTLVTGHVFGSVSEHAGSMYEPSIASDFSGFLPVFTTDGCKPVAVDYDADRVVQSAWKSLPNIELEPHWESDFWTRFFDPNTTALDMMTKGIKRPMPVPDASTTIECTEVEVERRIATKQTVEVKNFLQHIRDIPERTWREEREAQWEVAIRRWVALIETWEASEIPLAVSIQSKDSFQEKAQILVDVFYNKAPQTILKRCNSLAKLCGLLRQKGLPFPCNEDQFYSLLRVEVDAKAPSSRLKAYFEALVFCRYVLGVEELQKVVESRRCLGAASSKALTCPRQADPFTVEQLKKFHECLRAGEELWDRAMSGMVLFCVYGRSRWSDAQHAEELICDSDPSGVLQFIEVRTSVHKTARAHHLRHMFLPVAAPAHGVTDDCWGSQWLDVRRQLGIEDLKKFPLLPAPDSSMEPTARPVTTSEAKKWMHHLLGSSLMRPNARITSHSCKCTCLSYLAKRGAGYDDRLVLGYHANKLRMTMTYSRDSAARPLALLAHVLKEIREGIFEPDCTRSGRLRPGAAALDQFDLIGVAPVSRDGPASEEAVAFGDISLDTPAEVNQDKTLEPVEPVGQQDEGHLTTDSSDSSGEEFTAWAPIVGHYTVAIPDDKRLWLNSSTKMFHLLHDEHVRVLLCGRRISANFNRHDGQVSFDSAKCRQCFRLKDSSR